MPALFVLLSGQREGRRLQPGVGVEASGGEAGPAREGAGRPVYQPWRLWIRGPCDRPQFAAGTSAFRPFPVRLSSFPSSTFGIHVYIFLFVFLVRNVPAIFSFLVSCSHM